MRRLRSAARCRYEIMGQYPGLKNVLDMLREMTEEEQNRLLSNLESQDAQLVAAIRNELFQISDFLHVPAQELVKALRAFERDKLLMALKVAPEDVFDHIVQGMSVRAGVEFKEDFQNQGLHPLPQVQEVHRELVMYIKLMVDSGRLALIRPSEIVE